MHQLIIFFIVALFLFVASFSSATSAHSATCVHSERVVPFLTATVNETHHVSHHPELELAQRNAVPLAVGKIRFVLKTKALDDSNYYCASSSGSTSDMLGGTVACADDTILTATKRDVLINKLLPAALELISNTLHVQQLTTPIQVPAQCPKYYPKDAADTSPGVSGADYVLYVSAAPNGDSTTIGIGGACAFVSGSRRVSAGFINVSPRFLSTWETENDKNRHPIRHVAHEVLHALGASEFVYMKPEIGKVEAITIRGKPTFAVVTPKVLERYRKFTGCSTGRPELEDQGSAAKSHWERRNLADSILVGAAGGTMALDEITLALFEDTGYYSPVYERAEPMIWGKSAGCSFLDQTCGPSSPQMGSYWCQHGGAISCDYQLTGYGSCSIRDYPSEVYQNIPAYFRYFSDQKGGASTDLYDMCGLTRNFKNAHCTDSLIDDTAAAERGEIFSSNSRCVLTTGLLIRGYQQPDTASDTRCIQMRCPGGNRLQFRVRGDTAWYACPTDGSESWVNAPQKYSGKIFCPAASKVCSDPSLYIQESAASAAPPPAPDSASTAAASPSSPPSPGGGDSSSSSSAILVITLRAVSDDDSGGNYRPAIIQLAEEGGCGDPTKNGNNVTTKKIGAYELYVEFSSSSASSASSSAAAGMAKCVATLPEAMWRSAGFINVTQTAVRGDNSTKTGSGASDDDAPAFLSWVPIRPVWIFFVILGAVLLGVLLCCVCWYFKRKRDRGEGSRHVDFYGKQYEAFVDEEKAGEGAEEMTTALHSQKARENSVSPTTSPGTGGGGKVAAAAGGAVVAVPLHGALMSPRGGNSAPSLASVGSPSSAGNLAKKPAAKPAAAAAAAAPLPPSSSSSSSSPGYKGGRQVSSITQNSPAAPETIRRTIRRPMQQPQGINLNEV